MKDSDVQLLLSAVFCILSGLDITKPSVKALADQILYRTRQLAIEAGEKAAND